ncbi:GL25424 [Drosophila persimilis]|uniref:GL25424 n=1 Tax=Drosophila persimilis TaxID=7234 RepID=B4H8P4_DROPE|nr:GL25424 [Drosophila persimilis]
MDSSDSVNTHMCGIIEQQHNSSFRLQCSLSSVDSESDLSLAFEHDLGGVKEPSNCDELPAFEIRAFSPHGRTPSPIDDLNISDIETPKQHHPEEPACQNHPDFVALHEINAQITPPSDAEDTKTALSRSNSLETIFEGVFLNTPPREKPNNSPGSSRFTPKRVRANLMELVAIGNRVQTTTGKENQSPGAGVAAAKSPSPTTSPRKASPSYC